MTRIQSDGDPSSRRVRIPTMRLGSGSNAWTAMYSAVASYATRASVSNVGGAPSFGSR